MFRETSMIKTTNDLLKRENSCGYHVVLKLLVLKYNE